MPRRYFNDSIISQIGGRMKKKKKSISPDMWCINNIVALFSRRSAARTRCDSTGAAISVLTCIYI